jgi:hypothetical protein
MKPELYNRIVEIVSNACIVGGCKEFQLNQKVNQ